jgi:hypothetical protein
MKITMIPTPELTEIDVNGHPVPMRIWVGKTDSGIDVEVCVYATTPNNENEAEMFRDECRNSGMVRAAILADIGPFKKDPLAS